MKCGHVKVLEDDVPEDDQDLKCEFGIDKEKASQYTFDCKKKRETPARGPDSHDNKLDDTLALQQEYYCKAVMTWGAVESPRQSERPPLITGDIRV